MSLLTIGWCQRPQQHTMNSIILAMPIELYTYTPPENDGTSKKKLL